METTIFLHFKGFSLTSTDSLISARLWLLNADPNDLFFTPGTGAPFDLIVGEMHREEMLADIDRMLAA